MYGWRMEALERIAVEGYQIFPAFLSAAWLSALNGEVDSWHSEGRFRPGAVGRERQQAPAIRQDSLAWWEPTALTPIQSEVWGALEQLKGEINQTLFLGLGPLEAHFALYAAGAFYARHFDAFAGERSRRLSLVLYINSGWQAEEGGELVLYPKLAESPVIIKPLGGTLVLFLSEEIEHAVLPAVRERRSIAGWWR